MKKVQSNSVLILSESDFKTMGKWGKGFDYYEPNPKDSLIDVFSGAYYYHSDWDFGFQITEKPNGDYFINISSVWQTILSGNFPVTECISKGFSKKEINKEFLNFLMDGIEQTYNDYWLPIVEANDETIIKDVRLENLSHTEDGKMLFKGENRDYIVDIDKNLKGEIFVTAESECVIKSIICTPEDKEWLDVMDRCIGLVDTELEESILINNK